MSIALATGSSPTPVGDSIRAQIETLPSGQLRFREITFEPTTRTIRFPATINMKEGLLEYALVHENGKIHESLFSTKISPFDLNIVLLLCHYRPSKKILAPLLPTGGKERVALEALPEDPAAELTLQVSWKKLDGNRETVMLENLIDNLDTKKPAKAGPWIFSGSGIEDGNFMAEVDGTFAATYLDSRTLINSPRKGNLLDTIWQPSSSTPAEGIAVTIIITPYQTPKNEPGPR